VPLNNSTYLIFAFLVVMQAVSPLKTYQTVKVLHLYLLFYYNFLTLFIVRVGMLNIIYFTWGLNTTVTIVFRNRDCLKLWQFDEKVNEL